MSLTTTAHQVVIKKQISKKTQKPYFFFEVMKPQMKFIQAKNNDAKITMALSSLAESGQPVDINMIQNGDNNFEVDADFII